MALLPFSSQSSGGGGSSITIGEPIIGGAPNSILFIDGSGNLSQDNDLVFDSILNWLIVANIASSTGLPINVIAIMDGAVYEQFQFHNNGIGVGTGSSLSFFTNTVEHARIIGVDSSFIITTGPSSAERVKIDSNGLRLAGNTSGNVTISTKAIAGIWTLTLPDNDGNAGDSLQTDGSGITSWVASEEKTTTASSSTPTPTGGSARNFFTVTALAANATFAVPSGSPVDGNLLTVRIKDNATARTLAWNAIYRAGTSVALPTTTTISKTMYVGFRYNSASSTWDLLAVVDGL